jgi:hypothetical protein
MTRFDAPDIRFPVRSVELAQVMDTVTAQQIVGMIKGMEI